MGESNRRRSVGWRILPQLSKWGATHRALTRPATRSKLVGIRWDSECLYALQITIDFERDPSETGRGQGGAPCNAGCEVWTPHRASLFCVRWQGFLLGSRPETEACCTREARAAAAHHGIATNCTHCRRVPRRLGAALVHPGAWEGEADSEIRTPGTCPGHPSAPSEISAVCGSNASR
jgi:hypothetical protein